MLQRVRQITADTGCDPALMELEITESMIMGNDDKVTETLRVLSDLGFRISIDDFGTGYSNLAYIQRYPVNSLKIDRSFVADLKSNSAITELIIAMCQLIGAKIIAEGVETEDQLTWLARKGCDEYQGYLFSRPVPLHEFDRLLAASLNGRSRHPVRLVGVVHPAPSPRQSRMIASESVSNSSSSRSASAASAIWVFSGCDNFECSR